MTGHYCGLLPNSSMAIIFGGRFLNMDVDDNVPREFNGFLSNRLSTVDLSSPGSPFLQLIALGDQPSDRQVFILSSLVDAKHFFFQK